MDDGHGLDTVLIANELQRLRSDLDTVKEKTRDVDRPWYQQASPLISALSFAFAVVAACVSGYVSLYHDRIQELAAYQTSLRNLIQQLLLLENQPPTGANVNALYLTVAQAKAVIREVESRSPGTITAPEYNAVANSLIITRDLTGALDYSDKALARSDTLMDDLAARRGKATALILTEKYADGSNTYSAALSSAPASPFVKYRRLNDKGLLLYSDAYTYGNWASALFIMDKCAEGEKMLSAEIDLQKSLTPPAQQAAMAGDLTRAAKAGTPCL